MSISTVYEKYLIVPILRTHQLRVAAVALCLSRSLERQIDERSVVLACLLHDMGNVIKFDLGLFPEAFKKEGIDYWRSVQNEFREKYQNDEHVATAKIAEELGVSAHVRELIDAVGFSKARKHVSPTDVSIEKKVCCYSDYRVSPYGIVTLEESFADRRGRYADNPRKISSPDFVREAEDAFRLIETQIFELSSFRPADINDESVAPYIEEVQNISL